MKLNHIRLIALSTLLIGLFISQASAQPPQIYYNPITGLPDLSGACSGCRQLTPFGTLSTQLSQSQSAAFQVISDSTADETTEWPYLLGQWIGTLYPAYNVYWRNWDDTSSTFLAPVTIQTGTNGPTSITVTGTGSAVMDVTYLANPTTDIDLRVNVALASWTPATRQALVNHGFSGAGNHGIYFWVNSVGGGLALCWQWSVDGTADLFKCSSAAPPNPGAGVAQWVRVTHTLNNGSGGNDVKFWTSPDYTTWTQLGTTQTTASTTSYYASTPGNWEIGGTSTSNGATGTFYAVELWQAGKIVNPQPIDIWFNTFPTAQRAGVSLGGGPTLNIINASKAGADVAYWADSTRGPKALPNYQQTTFIVPLLHNDSTHVGGTYLTPLASLLSSVSTAFPGASITLGTENPRGPEISNAYNMSIRRQNILSWGPKNGYPVVDTYQQFLNVPTWLTTLLNVDHIHPNTAGKGIILSQYQRAFLGSSSPF